MITLHLTYVNRTPRTSAGGKPYTSLSLKATEYGDKFLSGFGNKDNASWKEGDVVEVAEVKEVVKGDKTYLNFEMPKKPSTTDLENRLLAVESELELVKEYIKQSVVPALKELQAKPETIRVAGVEMDYPQDGREPKL